MPKTTVAERRRNSHDVANSLVNVEVQYKPLLEIREGLKADLREYGAQVYITPAGVVTVGEPEVRKFVGRTLKLDPTLATTLPKAQFDALVAAGIFVWEDQYSRNAVAKVETKLT